MLMSLNTDFDIVFRVACYHWRKSDDVLTVIGDGPGFPQLVLESFCCLNNYDYNRQDFRYGLYNEVTDMVNARDKRLRDKIIALKRSRVSHILAS